MEKIKKLVAALNNPHKDYEDKISIDLESFIIYKLALEAKEELSSLFNEDEFSIGDKAIWFDCDYGLTPVIIKRVDKTYLVLIQFEKNTNTTFVSPKQIRKPNENELNTFEWPNILDGE